MSGKAITRHNCALFAN